MPSVRAIAEAVVDLPEPEVPTTRIRSTPHGLARHVVASAVKFCAVPAGAVVLVALSCTRGIDRHENVRVERAVEATVGCVRSCSRVDRE
jgi:hypothetical protein